MSKYSEFLGGSVMGELATKIQTECVVSPPRLVDEGMMALRILKQDDDVFVFFKSTLFARYERDDFFSRNHTIVQLHQCCRIKYQVLSDVFELSPNHIGKLVRNYREQGSCGVQSDVAVSSKNRQKIDGKILAFIRTARSVKWTPLSRQKLT
ncbi:hypothetical protein WDW86_18750 [Bdellovibrionota bacterium FG-2]